ncbi:MAG: NAD-binding protein, partial [Gammaproteobacteria bacterium]|nr:NAD-binding protein [Gammaproteobacteria bacterium]
GVVLVVGTIGYRILAGEQYSWFDGFYMTFITLTTIGYGEIIDLSKSPGGRLFTVIIGTAGLGTLWFMFSTLTVLILEGDLNQTLRRRRMEKIIKKLSGHYIVCGFGRVGRNVAAELDATNRRYAAIDEDLQMLEEQKEKNSELLYLHGDASDDDLLLSADIKDAAGVFAVTGDDSRNLMIALTAKQLNPAVRVVARCHEIRNAEKLRKAGADAIVSPDFTGGKRIASAMVRPTVQTFLDEMLRSEQRLRVEEVTVPAGFAPRAFGQQPLHDPNYVILALRRRSEWLFNPADDCLLEPGNILIVMASPHGRQVLEKKLAERQG